MYRLLLIIFYCLLTLKSNANDIIELDKIYYNANQDGNYAITFGLSEQANYQIINTNDEAIIDFFNTKFAAKNLSKQLDKNFIRNISRASDTGDSLRVTIKLAKNVFVANTYTITQGTKSFVVVILKNNAQKPINEASIKAKKFVIMIDPGHGGIDKGAIGSNLHIQEKKLTLQYAKELKRELSKYPQYQVFLTRDADVFMSSGERLQKSKEVKADIFISLHADFHADPKMKGASIYTLPQEAIVQEVTSLIEQKNKNNLLKNTELLKENQQIADMLLHMVYQDTQNASINLAKVTTEALTQEVEILNKAHRALELKVLKGVDTPAILIELGYLSNKDEEKQLNSLQYRKLFVQALVQGINRWQEIK